MPREAVIDLTIDWRRQSPEDLHQCYCCEESIFLTEYQLITLIDGREWPANFFLCESCFEAVKD